MKDNIEIAVIITIHNRLKETLECLGSVYKQELDVDIYLTDDGSDKGTSEIIQSKYPKVNIINGDGTLFWNRGMYKAWSAAVNVGYDYYLWLNNDTTLLDNSISILITSSLDEGDNAIVCGSTINNYSEKQMTYGGYDKNINILSLSPVKQYCEFASGNIILVPNKIVKAIGILDFKYRHSLGDFDYEGRARKAGFRIVQAPNYYGVCERHSKIAKWRDTGIPLSERLKFLYSPLGRNPVEFFYYDKRHYNYLVAIMHYFTIHLRCFFPKLWGKRYEEKE